jgi:anaerobic dimethyl sulfoxide reductase subunit C (anchor subunit)
LQVRNTDRDAIREHLPLVLFTLLAQAGIGLWLAALVLGAGPGPARAAGAGAVLLTALGLGTAFLHLGRPLGAHRALANLKSSWLSRECLLLGGFLVLGAVRAALAEAGIRSGPLDWAGLLVGVLGLVSMASLYGQAAMPAWRPAHTHLSFHTAAVAMGAEALALVAAGSSSGAVLVPAAMALAAGAVTVQLVGSGLHLARTGATRTLAAGLVLTAAGGVGGPVLALGVPGLATGWLVLAAALLAAGQGRLRYAHYAAGVHAMATGWADIPYRPRRRAAGPR